uniref:Uncharacterized protein n=1 Tax=Anguilla anguilla TaxID=7936 RepID=A0A0E9V9C8_ANGAN
MSVEFPICDKKCRSTKMNRQILVYRKIISR